MVGGWGELSVGIIELLRVVMSVGAGGCVQTSGDFSPSLGFGGGEVATVDGGVGDHGRLHSGGGQVLPRDTRLDEIVEPALVLEMALDGARMVIAEVTFTRRYDTVRYDIEGVGGMVWGGEYVTTHFFLAKTEKLEKLFFRFFCSRELGLPYGRRILHLALYVY